MDTVWQDIRYCFRTMLKNPGFTAVAVAALALGIGANSAIFSVVNAVLLRPLPYADPDRIVAVNKIVGKGGFPGIASPEFFEWRKQNEVFEHISAYSSDNFNLLGDEPERVAVAKVTASFFPLLGVNPALGRTFADEEDQPGHNQVVVISQGFWQQRFAGDPDLSNKTLTLDDKIYAIVGVMPASFEFPPAFDIWMPLALDVEAETRGDMWKLVEVIARLKRDVTRERAQSDLNVIAGRLEQQQPDTMRGGARLDVVPLHQSLVGDLRLAILVLLGAVGFVLLIACANVANLLLARATGRQKEIAIRIAVGAGRGRLVRQFLTESIMLALAGGTLGVLLALWGLDLLVAGLPRDIADSLPALSTIHIDGQALGFTLAISVLTGLVFGLAPAIVASKPDLNEMLKEGDRRTSDGSGLVSLRGLLVVSELALALVLLIGAGLLVKSFVRLLEVEPGFNPENVLTMRVELPSSKYRKPRQKADFFDQLLTRVRALAQVESAGVINHSPFSGHGLIAFFGIEGADAPEPGQEQPVPVGVVSPDYFTAMQIPLLKGRFFNDADAEGTQLAVIINESFRRRFWPDEDPTGKRLGFGCRDGLCRTVVGVVGDTQQEGLNTELRPEIYVPYSQMPIGSLMLAVRTSSDPASMIAAVRSQVLAVDKDQPVSQIKTMEQHISDSIAQPRLFMVLLGTFAALALTLAAVGIYGVMSYTVTQRTREIGIRMALGAEVSDILRLVLKQGLTLALAGAGIGALAAFLLTRIISSLLFKVEATDFATFATVSIALIAVAMLACYVPARRAARVDPMIALRYE